MNLIKEFINKPQKKYTFDNKNTHLYARLLRQTFFTRKFSGNKKLLKSKKKYGKIIYQIINHKGIL